MAFPSTETAVDELKDGRGLKVSIRKYLVYLTHRSLQTSPCALVEHGPELRDSGVRGELCTQVEVARSQPRLG